MKLRLQPGHFYLSKGGDIWCCYRLRKFAPGHTAADCINTVTSAVEYFYIDGRYDEAGEREHTLVKECGPTL